MSCKSHSHNLPHNLSLTDYSMIISKSLNIMAMRIWMRQICSNSQGCLLTFDLWLPGHPYPFTKKNINWRVKLLLHKVWFAFASPNLDSSVNFLWLIMSGWPIFFFFKDMFLASLVWHQAPHALSDSTWPNLEGSHTTWDNPTSNPFGNATLHPSLQSKKKSNTMCMQKLRNSNKIIRPINPQALEAPRCKQIKHKMPCLLSPWCRSCLAMTQPAANPGGSWNPWQGAGGTPGLAAAQATAAPGPAAPPLAWWYALLGQGEVARLWVLLCCWYSSL